MKRITIFILLATVSLWLFPQLSREAEFLKSLNARISQLEKTSGAERLTILEPLARQAHQRDAQEGYRYAREGLELLKLFPDREAAFKPPFLIHLARASAKLHPHEQALKTAETALEAARTSMQPTLEAEALEILGNIYAAAGNNPKAKSYYEQSLKLFRLQKNTIQSAVQENNLGRISWRMGDYVSSLKKIMEALKILEKSDDGFNLAIAYAGLSSIYSELEDHEKSLDYSMKALAIYQETGNRYYTARLLNNISMIYLAQNKFDLSLEFLQKSIRYKTELQDGEGLANSYNNMGDLYKLKKEYDNAITYYSLSLEAFEKLNDKPFTDKIAINLIQRGKMKRLLGQGRKALEDVKMAIGLGAALNKNNIMKDAHLELAEIHESLNDPKQSLYHYQQFKTLNDAIFNENSRKKIAELQTNYELEKKEKELNLLKKESEIRELKLDRQKTFQNSFLLISGLILFLAFVTYRRYRFKSKLTGVLKKEIEEHHITSRKLRESEEKFRVLAEKSVVGIAIIQNNVFRYLNPRFVSIFGYPHEELLKKTLPDLVVEEHRNKIAEALNMKTDGSRTTHIEFRGKTGAGEIIHLECFGALTQYEGQQAILETIIDITDRKLAEAELLKARKLETVGILAGGIAQDFDRLLGVINENIFSAIQDTQEQPQALKMLESANKASNQAGDLAKKLMTFSEGGWIQPQEVSVATLFKNTLSFHPEFKPYIGGMNIPEGLNPVNADERQFRQVFYNLLQNAVEAKTALHSIQFQCENITLGAQNSLSLPEGEYVRMSISDKGNGISRVHLEKIFDPYFSTKNNVTQKGIGLGLALCYSIIKKHNGHISVFSAEDDGTTIEIYLPSFSRNP